MNFKNDIMISYAWRDNQVAPMTKAEGWVSSFQEGLEYWLKQMLPRPPKVWRDKNQMPGNKVFAQELDQTVADTAILLAVISEPYLSSEWCGRELDNFVTAAESQGGLNINNNYRIFKINKLPVDRNALPARLQVVTGFDFYDLDSETRVMTPVDPTFGDAQKQIFMRKVYDVAVAMARILNEMESAGMSSGKVPVVPPPPATPGDGKPADGNATGGKPAPQTEPDKASTEATAASDAAAVDRKLYILHDAVDRDAVREVRKALRGATAGGKPVTLLLPVFDGNAAAIQEFQRQRLVEADAVLLYWGACSEAWLQAQLAAVRNATGHGRPKEFRWKHGIYIAGPKTGTKEDWLLDFEDGILDPDLGAIDALEGVASGPLEKYIQTLV